MSDAPQTCPSCGATSPADAQFCRDCGAILVRGGESPRGAGRLDADFPAPGGPPPTQEKRGRALLWVIALVIAIGIGVALYNEQEVSQIPVPGEAPVEPTVEVVPTELPAPLPPPVREPEAARKPDRVEEPPPRGRDPDYEPEPDRPRDEPAPGRPSRSVPPPREPEPELPSIESGPGGRALRPGWYRMKFRAPLFQSPSETAPIITQLKAGTRIRVTHVVPGFLAVESTTGKAPGYVSSDDAAPDNAAGR